MSQLRGAHLHLDCPAGIAGDMALAALLDLGVPELVVRDAIDALGLPGIKLECTTVRRGAFVGRKVEVRHHGQAAGSAHGPVTVPIGHHGDDHDHHDHAHHPYRAIRERIVARAQPAIARWALEIFDRLATVEGQRHGVPVAEVAFHELGGVDSIADIVGCAAALAWLAPSSASCRPVPLGGGTVRTAHGRLEVPAPATLELLLGCAVETGGEHELTTPTGAAIVRALVDTVEPSRRFGAMPDGRLLGVGWGAGTRDLADRPNLLRVVALARAATMMPDRAPDEVEVLETNLDDLSPNLAAPLLDALLDAGALDAWLTPIVMKKGRPGLMVSALVPLALRAAIEEVFFRESTTLGIRRRRHDRTVLDRKIIEVSTELGPIMVKLAGRRVEGDPDPEGDLVQVYSASPELEDCRRVAAATGTPLRRVYEPAAAAAASCKTS